LQPYETLQNAHCPQHWFRSDIFQALGQKLMINGDNTLGLMINTDEMMLILLAN
jgi:hypothetical protein